MTADDGDQVGFCLGVYPRLVSFLRLYSGDRSLAEDLAQEALARALADWENVAAMESPDAWVHRVAMNLASSWFRRRSVASRAARRLIPDLAPATEADWVETVDVQRSLARLPLRQRQAVLLRHLGQLSVAETAVAMGCAQGTVRALTAQGIERLRALAQDHEEVTDGR